MGLYPTNMIFPHIWYLYKIQKNLCFRWFIYDHINTWHCFVTSTPLSTPNPTLPLWRWLLCIMVYVKHIVAQPWSVLLALLFSAAVCWPSWITDPRPLSRCPPWVPLVWLPQTPDLWHCWSGRLAQHIVQRILPTRKPSHNASTGSAWLTLTLLWRSRSAAVTLATASRATWTYWHKPLPELQYLFIHVSIHSVWMFWIIKIKLIKSSFCVIHSGYCVCQHKYLVEESQNVYFCVSQTV